MKEIINIKRENNYDCLRIVCMIMVIFLHQGMNYATKEVYAYSNNFYNIGNFFNTFTNTAVPCFVMMSGTFLLDQKKNLNLKNFYKKTWNTIFVPTFIFGIGYTVLSILMDMVKGDKGQAIVYLQNRISDFMNGNAYYHMWYMYMIIGMYAIVPILVYIRYKSVIVLFILGVAAILGDLIRIVPRLTYFWIFWWISYLGYFIIGFFIRKYLKNKIPTKLALFVWIFSMVMCCYLQKESFLFDKRICIGKINLYDVLLYLGTISVFICFTNLKIKSGIVNNVVEFLAPNCAYMYFYHAGIMTIVNPIAEKIIFHNDLPNPIYYIPIMFIVYFSLSLVISLGTRKIIQQLSERILRKKVKD